MNHIMQHCFDPITHCIFLVNSRRSGEMTVFSCANSRTDLHPAVQFGSNFSTSQSPVSPCGFHCSNPVFPHVVNGQYTSCPPAACLSRCPPDFLPSCRLPASARLAFSVPACHVVGPAYPTFCPPATCLCLPTACLPAYLMDNPLQHRLKCEEGGGTPPKRAKKEEDVHSDSIPEKWWTRCKS